MASKAFFPFPWVGGNPRVVVEDPDFLVLMKPAGMHTAPGSPSGEACADSSLLSWAAERYPEVGRIEGRGKGEGGLLHRLDRDTSGPVLFARSEEAFRFLTRKAENGEFKKEYVARAGFFGSAPAGCRPERMAPNGVDAREWTRADSAQRSARKAEIMRNALRAGRDVYVESAFRTFGPGSRRVACAAPDAELGKGRKAWGTTVYRTRILTAEIQDEAGLTEFSVLLVRGFRHQIRAHLAWIGFPLLGDPLYGGKDAERLFLHARRIVFPHPQTGYAIVVEA